MNDELDTSITPDEEPLADPAPAGRKLMTAEQREAKNKAQRDRRAAAKAGTQTTTEQLAEAPAGGAPMATTKTTHKSKSTKAKATKTAAPKKAKKAAAATPNGHDTFGLRKGSKVSQAAAMFARERGATMAEVKEKTGANQYNLIAALKEAGHKVKKDGATFFLS